MCGLCLFMKFLNPFTTSYVFYLHVLLLVRGLSVTMYITHSLGTFGSLPTMLLDFFHTDMTSIYPRVGCHLSRFTYCKFGMDQQ